MGLFKFCVSWQFEKKDIQVSEVHSKNAITPPSEARGVKINASSRVDTPVGDAFSSIETSPTEKSGSKQETEIDPLKALFDKKRSFSTLTAWQILAFNVQASSELDAIPESEPLNSPPPPPPLSSPPNSNDGWSTDRVETHYELLEELGHGAFGRVFKAKRRRDGALACVKVINVPGRSELVAEEVSTLRTLCHPHVVHLYNAYCDSEQRTAIAMELCSGGDLEKWLRQQKNCIPLLETNYLTEEEIMHCFVQVLLALKHIHARAILHRDIKTSNLFLKETSSETSELGRQQGAGERVGACSLESKSPTLFDYTIKLGDFGIAKSLEQGNSCAKTMLGTPCYFSPELIWDQPYGEKAEAWAAGCVLYELTALKRPFQGNSVSAVCVKILAGAAPPLPPDTSPDLAKLVSLLLTKDPRKRPSINTVLELPFVQKYFERYTQWRRDRGLGSLEEETLLMAQQGSQEQTQNLNTATERLASSSGINTASNASREANSLMKSDTTSQEALTVVQRVVNNVGSWGRSHHRRQAEGECQGELVNEEGEVQYVFSS
jgi:serine/threonine protein kinase